MLEAVPLAAGRGQDRGGGALRFLLLKWFWHFGVVGPWSF